MAYLRTAPWLALLLIPLVLAANSTVFIPDTNTTISLKFDSSTPGDIHFYVSSPDFFQYTAIGFGSRMSDALMLVMYPAADNSRVTISPRTSSGDTEPLFFADTKLTIHPNSGIKAHEMIVNATCHGCQTWPTGSLSLSSGSQSVLFANGPGIALSSDDPAAGIRRHVGYGSFPIDIKSASGNGPIVFGPDNRLNASQVTLLEGVVKSSSNKAAVAHGVVFVVTTLAIGPFDALVAGALRRWPVLHAVSATVYIGFVIGAFVPGVLVSREHVATQKFQTPHQAIGLLTVALLFAMYLWGAGLGIIRRSAKKRGQEPPEHAVLLGTIHRWAGRLIWVLLVVDGGLGLKLAERSNLFIMGYGVLVGGVFIFLVPVWFCVWRCTKYQREKETEQEELELHNTIYNHDRYN